MKPYHLMQVADLVIVLALAYFLSPYFLAGVPVALYTPWYRKAYNRGGLALRAYRRYCR